VVFGLDLCVRTSRRCWYLGDAVDAHHGFRFPKGHNVLVADLASSFQRHSGTGTARNSFVACSMSCLKPLPASLVLSILLAETVRYQLVQLACFFSVGILVSVKHHDG
jgi:hypothetical protein